MSAGTFPQALKLDIRLQHKYGFVYAAIFSSLLWEVFVYLLPDDSHPMALPYLIFGDLAIIGFFIVAGAVFFERGERTLFALLVTPMRFGSYYAAKLVTLTALSLVMAAIIAVSGVGLGFNLFAFVTGVVLCTLLFLMCSFISATPFTGITEWILPSTVVLAVLNIPLLSYSGLWDSYLPYVIPTQGAILLLGESFGRVAMEPWQWVYAVGYPLLWLGLLAVVSRKMFYKHIVASEGSE
ncbi:MAG: fluoroquinolone transporter permease [Stackebrandtia sp.]